MIEERNIVRKKENIQLSFEKWIFRNGQPFRDNDRINFVAMTSTEEQRSLF